MLLITSLAQAAAWAPAAAGTEGRSWEECLKEASRGACAILASGGP